jgi:hypothetical protein
MRRHCVVTDERRLSPHGAFYKRSVFWSLSLPAVALFYAGATVHSAIQYWRGRGGAWKGRVQDRRLS